MRDAEIIFLRVNDSVCVHACMRAPVSVYACVCACAPVCVRRVMFDSL